MYWRSFVKKYNLEFTFSRGKTLQQSSCPPLSLLNIGVSAKSWSTNWPKAARNAEMRVELIFLELAILLVIILAFGRSWPSLSLLISPMSAKWFKIYHVCLISAAMSSSLSWGDCLLTDSEGFFILLSEISQILVKISFISHSLNFHLSSST